MNCEEIGLTESVEQTANDLEMTGDEGPYRKRRDALCDLCHTESPYGMQMTPSAELHARSLNVTISEL